MHARESRGHHGAARIRVYGAAALATLLVATGCGKNQIDEANASPRPTIGSEELALDDSETSTTADGTDDPDQPNDTAEGTAEREVEIGPALAAGATAEEIRDVVEESHGYTSDAAGVMNQFAAFPAVPTPDHARIVELRADARNTIDGQWIIVTTEVTIRTTSSKGEVEALYTEAAADLGWSGPVRAAVFGPVGAERLAFDVPDAPYPLHDFEAELLPPSDDDEMLVRLRFVEQLAAGDDTVRARFEGWASDVPLPPGGEITGAGIQTSSVGRNSLHFTLAVVYPATTAGTVADQVRGGLPSGQYSADPQAPSGDTLDNWVYLSSPLFDDARVSTHGLADDEIGETRVNVDARIGFSPEP